jgi:hypothetical protein
MIIMNFDFISCFVNHYNNIYVCCISDSIFGKDEFNFLPVDTPIGLNVGGQMFESTVEILIVDPFSVLASLCRQRPSIKPNADGIFYLDRDWWLFRHILSFLRSGVLPRELEILKELYKEAFFIAWRNYSVQ